MNPWDTARLCSAVNYRVLESEGAIQSVLFEHEPYLGRPTEVFAYVGIPPAGTARVPGMVCVHGGLGAAFRSWVETWVKRGYAAIAMDLNGCGANRVPVAQRGPPMEDGIIFDPTATWADRWTYHAVAAVLRSHTLLRSFPTIDPGRIGITGISWGGYLTCIAASVDPRFACAIPVYGCGFLQTNSAADWLNRFAEMTPAQRQAWHDHCDPSVYLPAATAPMLFVSGTNDFAYPLDIVQKTYALPQSPVAFCVRVGMEHSQEHGVAPAEIELFADQHLRGGEPLPVIGKTLLTGRQLSARCKSLHPDARATVHYTTDRGRWQERKWQTAPASVDAGTVNAEIPEGVSAAFLGLTDDRGAYASSSPLEIG